MSMMPEDDDNMNLMTMMDEEEPDISQIDFSYVSKHPYINKVFCWIEAGETEEVKRFFNTFSHLLDIFYSPNNWNPFLYAVRYGNIDLIDYFCEKGAKRIASSIINTISIVHAAVYSGDQTILEYVFKKMDVEVNPSHCEISPLKAAMKANNGKMVEFLVSRGAYYIFGDVYNNLDTRTSVEETHKYLSLTNGKEIHQSIVVEESSIRDCPIKETLKYARAKNLMLMRKLAKKSGGIGPDHKFSALSSILVNDDNFNSMMRMAVNKGDSILKKGASDQPADL